MRYVFSTFCLGTKMRAILVYGGQCRHSRGERGAGAAAGHDARTQKKRENPQ